MLTDTAFKQNNSDDSKTTILIKNYFPQSTFFAYKMDYLKRLS